MNTVIASDKKNMNGDRSSRERLLEKAAKAERRCERYQEIERRCEERGLYEEALEAGRMRTEHEATASYWRQRADQVAA